MFFFFKQKTAYEMRISDWSSDVCSSDLLGDHDADDGVARGRIGELHIGGLVRLRKGDGGDDLVLRQRCLEHAGEEVVGGKLALAGVHRGAEADEARRVVGRRIVVGNRAPDSAAVAHLRRAEERMVGHACVRTCRYVWSPNS